ISVGVSDRKIKKMRIDRCRGSRPDHELARVASRPVAQDIGTGIDRNAADEGRSTMHLARVCINRAFGQRSGYVKAKIGIAGEKAAAHIFRKLRAEIAGDTGAFGTVVLTKSVAA